MYRIAILDDNTASAQHLAQVTRDILSQWMLDEGSYCVDTFDQSDSFVTHLSDSQNLCDLILTDIRLKDGSGIDLVKELQHRGCKSRVVYFSAYQEYVFDSFDTHPLQYLLKPIQQEKLEEVLRYDYLQNIRHDNLRLQLRNCDAPISLDELYYAEVFRHKLTLHLTSGIQTSSVSMTALCESLPSRSFFRCHQSYVVNMRHVRKISRYQAELDNGEFIPISKLIYKTFWSAYILYIESRMPSV